MERGGQVTGNMKVAIFFQVWHPYMQIHTITDEVINIKDVDLSLVRAGKQNIMHKGHLQHEI